MTTTSPMKNRWDVYFMRGGSEFVPFWQSLVGSGRRDLLFVLGKGFDPRMCKATETILSLGGEGIRQVLLIDYDEGPASPSNAHVALVEANLANLHRITDRHGGILSSQIEMRSKDGRRRVGPRRSAEAFDSLEMIEDYTDILIDISALPRALYMPMINKVLHLIDGSGEKKAPNLHVLTEDNPSLDQLIVAEGLDDDSIYLYGFESGIELEATAHIPKVWMPILGEGKVGHFWSMYQHIAPDEIAPVLPFPCSSPRRTDDLILEYREVLFDRLRIESSNIIYAPEQNPFGVYRELVSAATRYIEAMDVLHGCKIVFSILSSKLLSVGVLLAAYDLKRAGHTVGIAHVQAEGYRMGNETVSSDSPGDLFEVWIAGEPYAT